MNSPRRTFFTTALVAGAIQLAVTVVALYQLLGFTDRSDTPHPASQSEIAWSVVSGVCAFPLAPLLHLSDFWTLFIGPSGWLILLSNSAIWGFCIAALISPFQQKTSPSPLRRFITNQPVLVSILSIGLVLLCAVLAITAIHADAKKEAMEMSQLVGSWTGEESWGTRWTITRRADGTFSQTLDFSQADVPHHPEIVKCEGHFYIQGSAYGYIYTKSTNPEFLKYPEAVFDIDTLSDTRLSYRLCEGNYATETKKPPAP